MFRAESAARRVKLRCVCSTVIPRRRALQPAAARPMPRRERVAGSGTGLISSLVGLKNEPAKLTVEGAWKLSASNRMPLAGGQRMIRDGSYRDRGPGEVLDIEHEISRKRREAYLSVTGVQRVVR